MAAMRQQGEEHFHIWPATTRADFFPITDIEPQNARNDAAFGFDAFADPVARVAMEHARDLSRSAASGRMTLVQEITPEKQPGFLIFFPVYQGGIAPGTVA